VNDRWHQALRAAYVAELLDDRQRAAQLLRQLYGEVRARAVTRDGAEVLAWTCWLSARIAFSLGATSDAAHFCTDGLAWSVPGGDARVMNHLCRLRSLADEESRNAAD
jgi:hypothetical protein